MVIFGKFLAYAWPLLVILALIFTYSNAPHFFVSYIFQIQNREFQVVEILTFIAVGMAGFMLLMSTWKFWKRDNYWPAGLVGLVAVGALFFAGEPISWGQSYLQWDTPALWREKISGETNLHNSQFPVHQLAALFVFSMFFLFPFCWQFRHYLSLLVALEPAIPEGPVISALGISVIFRELKGMYREFSPLWYRQVDIPWVEFHDQFYQEFLWGMNEYREMLVALTLLMYAGYPMAAAKKNILRN